MPISRRRFDAKAEAGWTDRGDPNFRIVNDPSSPASPPKVGQAVYPAGFPSGSGPINTSLEPQQPVTRLYLSFWLKLSANWWGNNSGVNKILYVWIHNNPSVYLSAQGAGAGTLQPQVRLQNVPGGARNLTPNVARSAQLRRGVWQRWDLMLEANAPHANNGKAEWWIDGRLVGRYDNLVFAEAGQSRTWDKVSINPTYGGRGAPVRAEQTMSFDDFYVSGR